MIISLAMTQFCKGIELGYCKTRKGTKTKYSRDSSFYKVGHGGKIWQEKDRNFFQIFITRCLELKILQSLMDQRQTFNDNNELLSLVTSICNEKIEAFLLIDREGLMRVEGVITSIDKHDDIENIRITISGRDRVLLKEIIGINGLFRSDYSEC